MNAQNARLLNKRITEFRTRKAKEFPETGIEAFLDYEQYDKSAHHSTYRQLSQF